MFDLKFGLLAKKVVGCSAPGLEGRLGVEFPEVLFFREHRKLSSLEILGWAGPQGAQIAKLIQNINFDPKNINFDTTNINFDSKNIPVYPFMSAMFTEMAGLRSSSSTTFSCPCIAAKNIKTTYKKVNFFMCV